MVRAELIEDVDIAFNQLSQLTRRQDKLQLSIPAINESTAISLAGINNANAVILELSRYKGDLEPVIKIGYLRNKVLGLVGNFNGLAHDYGLCFGKPVIKFNIEAFLDKRYIDIPEGELEKNKDMIFRGVRLDAKTHKLKKLKEVI